MRIIMHVIIAFVCAVPVPAQTSTWEPMNRGLHNTLVYSIAIDPTDSLVMYCGTDFGRLYVSLDGGFNWALSNEGIPDSYRSERVTALLIDPGNRRSLWAGFSGRESAKNLFRSTDAGQTWGVVDTPEDWKSGGILHIHRTGGAAPKLICGLGWFHGVFISSDDGRSWTNVLGDLGIQCVTSHPARPAVLFAGASSRSALMRSSDAGATWREAQAGIAVNAHSGVRSLACVPSNPDVIYAGVTGYGQGLHRSTDGGFTWDRLNSVAEISEIAIHPWNPGVIYISAIGTGVHRSLDGGLTWARISTGLPTMDVMRVLIAPGYPVRVFAVTLRHGIYRLVDEELAEDMFTR